MATEPSTERQRLFLTFLFGFAGSLFANFIVKQTTSPVTPVAKEEPPPPQFASELEDEQSGGL